MGWLDNWIAELAPPVPQPTQCVTPAKQRPKPVIKTVCPQTRAPRKGDAGECAIGYYSISDDVLTMHDVSGKPGKTYRLGPDDNERVIASRLTVEAWRAATPDFNRPLNCQWSGVAKGNLKCLLQSGLRPEGDSDPFLAEIQIPMWRIKCVHARRWREGKPEP